MNPIKLESNKLRYIVTFYSKKGKYLDIDSFVGIIYKDKIHKEFIYFGNTIDRLTSIHLKGDLKINKFSIKNYASEVTVIDLKKLEQEIQYLDLGFFIYPGTKGLKNIDKVEVRLEKYLSRSDIYTSIFTKFNDSPTFVVGRINLKGGSWEFHPKSTETTLTYAELKLKYTTKKLSRSQFKFKKLWKYLLKLIIKP